MAVENAYLPFNFIRQDNGKPDGWDYEVITEICRRLNAVPEFKQIAWDAMIQAVSSGQLDMAGDGVTITRERSAVVDFSRPYMKVEQKLMIRSGETRFGSLEEIVKGSFRIAAQKGNTNYERAVELVGAARVTGFDSFGDAVQALITGDMDALAIDDTAGQGYMGAQAGKLKMLPDVLASQELGFVFPKGSALTGAFNAALEAMGRDGSLEGFTRKWFPPAKDPLPKGAVPGPE